MEISYEKNYNYEDFTIVIFIMAKRDEPNQIRKLFSFKWKTKESLWVSEWVIVV